MSHPRATRCSIVGAALGLSLALAACSVSTPRDGSVATRRSAVSGAGAGDTAEAGAPGGAQTGDTAPGGGGGAVGLSGSAAATGAAGSGTAAAGSRSASSSGGAQSPAAGSGAAVAPKQPAADGSTVGVTPTSITVSLLAGFSGPYGSLFKTWADNAFGTWADEINANGGVNGRKIIIHQVDNRDTAEGGIAACKEVQGNGSFLAVSMAGLGGADMSSSDCLDQAKIPVIAFNLAGYRSNWRYVVSVNDDSKQAVPIASFIKNVINDGGGKTGMIVVNDPIQLASRDAIGHELERLGIARVKDEIVNSGQGSFVAELSRLRSAGATTVIMDTGSESIGIVRDANAIGYHPNFTGLYWTLDEFSQAAGQLWSGIKAIRVFATSESKAYAEYQQKAAKYGHSVVSTTVMAYYGGAVMISDIMAKVGPALGRDGFIKAAGQLGTYSNGIQSVVFPPGKLLADVAVFPVVCCNPDNTWKGLGDPKLAF